QIYVISTTFDDSLKSFGRHRNSDLSRSRRFVDRKHFIIDRDVIQRDVIILPSFHFLLSGFPSRSRYASSRRLTSDVIVSDVI
uniref:Uncharacterized protein n=1 Tax=Ciona intestinalis TaxID=7719 RepID=F6XPA9_CIOIN